MSKIGIIPARGGSKGIKDKNIIELCGKPLIQYTIEAALLSEIDRVIVSTDSNKIVDLSKHLGSEVVIRPPELAEDNTPTLPVIHHVLSQINSDYDMVVLLQPTSPLRNYNHINRAIELFNNSPDADSLVSVVKVPHNMIPEAVMTESEGYLKSYISNSLVNRRQDKPVYFARNGAAIYITRKDSIDKFIYGGKILPYHMKQFESVDIDTIEDLKLAELLIKYKLHEV